MKTSTVALAVAVLAFAIVGFAMIPEVDADTAVTDTENGTIAITITGGENVPSVADVEALTKDLSSAKLYIPIDPEADVGFTQMNDYEKIKPYISSSFVVVGFDVIKAMSAEEWAGFVESVLKFANEDEGTPILAYAPATGVWSGSDAANIKVVMTFPTPKAIEDKNAAEIAAIYDELGEISLELGERMEAFIKTLPTEDEDGAAIEYTTFEIYELFIKSLDASVADLSGQVTDLTEEKAGLVAQVEELSKPKAAVPFYETGAGQCAIIIIIFLVILVAWSANKQGMFNKFKLKFKKKEAKE